MPTLAPPPPARETSRPLHRRQERKQVWLERFLGSRYFLYRFQEKSALF